MVNPNHHQNPKEKMEDGTPVLLFFGGGVTTAIGIKKLQVTMMCNAFIFFLFMKIRYIMVYL